MKSHSVGLLLVAAATAGCFDDAKLRPPTGDLGTVDVPSNPVDVLDARVDVATPDAATDVSLDAVDVADASNDSAEDADATDASDVPTSGCPLTRVLVTTSDYARGGYAVGAFTPTPTLTPSSEMAPDQDHMPVQSGCVVYNLLRGNDVLAVLDPMNLPTIARRVPLRMGSDSSAPYQINPYDVYTYLPEKAYVVQYAVPRIAVVNPTRDGADAVLRTIDLSPVRAMEDLDSSGSPEASAIVRAGRYLFVALQNLNAFAPVTNGSLAVIDPTGDVLVDVDPSTSSVIDPVRLAGRNPAAVDVTRGGRIVVAESGVVAYTAPQMLDGGIEWIDPATFRSSGLLVTEAQLGGDIKALVMLDESRAWVVVTQLASSTSMNPSARVVEVNLDAADGSRIGRTIVSTGDIAGLAKDPTGNVWVLDRTPGHAGARVFNNMGMEVTSAPLSSGMYPPSGIAFVP